MPVYPVAPAGDTWAVFDCDTMEQIAGPMAYEVADMWIDTAYRKGDHRDLYVGWAE